MNIDFRKHDKHGSFQVIYKHRIFEVIAKGAIGDALTKHFATQLMEAFSVVKDNQWAFFGNLRDCDGYTPESEGLLSKTLQAAQAAGCIVDAFVIKSPMVKAQVNRIRLHAGVSSPLDYHDFDHREKALAFLQSVLDNPPTPATE